MPKDLIQLNSQCYGFIDNTQGKTCRPPPPPPQKKGKKYTEISSEAFVLALQQKIVNYFTVNERCTKHVSTLICLYSMKRRNIVDET